MKTKTEEKTLKNKDAKIAWHVRGESKSTAPPVLKFWQYFHFG